MGVSLTGMMFCTVEWRWAYLRVSLAEVWAGNAYWELYCRFHSFRISSTSLARLMCTVAPPEK